MTLTSEQIEWIVAEVMRRLRQQANQPADSPTTPELSLNEKVITVKTLEGRLAGVSRLMVSQKAVITPAARDELKDRNVELVRRGVA